MKRAIALLNKVKIFSFFFFVVASSRVSELHSSKSSPYVIAYEMLVRNRYVVLSLFSLGFLYVCCCHADIIRELQLLFVCLAQLVAYSILPHLAKSTRTSHLQTHCCILFLLALTNQYDIDNIYLNNL